MNKGSSQGIFRSAFETGARLVGAVPVVLVEALLPVSVTGVIADRRAAVQKWTGIAVAAIMGYEILVNA